jgi:hypothetical protein
METRRPSDAQTIEDLQLRNAELAAIIEQAKTEAHTAGAGRLDIARILEGARSAEALREVRATAVEAALPPLEGPDRFVTLTEARRRVRAVAAGFRAVP